MTQLRVTRPAVEVDGLTKTYPGGVHAVRGITFTVDTAEVFGLLGPNGAGKSTTIGMLTTTVAPTAGIARVAGFDVVSQPLAARAVSATVFQEQVLDQGLSGRRNLEIHARLWGVDARTARRRIDGLVERFGLGEVVDRGVRGRVDGDPAGASRRRRRLDHRHPRPRPRHRVDQHPPADARRRLPAPHRRPHRRLKEIPPP